MTGTSDLLNDTPPPSSGGQGPGRLVRQAREKTKLSLEDLAAQIKLSRFTLDAIERDDFSQLNEPVYVRGYYRKLSKVLPVVEADLIAAYERVAGHKTPPHPSKLILAGGSELGRGRRVSLKLAVSIILIGLLIGALAFWGKNRVATTTETPTTGATTQLPAVTAEPLVPESSGAAVATPPVETPSVTTTPAPTAPVTTPAPAPVVTPPPRADAATPAAQAAVASSAAGPLLLQFSGSSWTEVKDSTGKILLSGLVESGSTQGLDGRPPFQVFLGNAPAVTVVYNGQPVDLAQFRRGDNTARITLP